MLPKYKNKEFVKLIEKDFGIYISKIDSSKFNKENAKTILNDKLKNNDYKQYDIWINAAGGLMEYLIETRKTPLAHIREIIVYNYEQYMILDSTARKNLEILENIMGIR